MGKLRERLAKRIFTVEGRKFLENLISNSSHLLPTTNLNILFDMAIRCLIEANTPYRPGCRSEELARKILNHTRKVTLFDRLRHVTSPTAVTSICDNALYAQNALRQFLLPFSPAALAAGDILNGDGKAICFGPNEIGVSTFGKVEFIFDVTKMKIDKNPCIFYKQGDLGFSGIGDVTSLKKQIAIVKLGKYTLQFRYNSAEGKIIFSNSEGRVFATAVLPKYLLIPHNRKNLHQILTLNFFRLLDRLEIPSSSENSDDLIAKQLAEIAQFKENTYAAINDLDEKELVEFLTIIGRKMILTCEFNFYVAYQADFSSIEAIRFKSQSGSTYTLVLSSFIKELEDGNQELLAEARKNIPNLFKSYRFLDYLLSNIQNKTIRIRLESLRSDLNVPLWRMKREQTESLNYLQLLIQSLRTLILKGGTDLKKCAEEVILKIKELRDNNTGFTLDTMIPATGRRIRDEINTILGQGMEGLGGHPLGDRVMAIFQETPPIESRTRRAFNQR